MEFSFSLRNVCMYDGGSELSHSFDDISIGIIFLFFLSNTKLLKSDFIIIVLHFESVFLFHFHFHFIFSSFSKHLLCSMSLIVGIMGFVF